MPGTGDPDNFVTFYPRDVGLTAGVARFGQQRPEKVDGGSLAAGEFDGVLDDLGFRHSGPAAQDIQKFDPLSG